MSEILRDLRMGFANAGSGDGWWEIPDTLMEHLSASSVGMFMRCPEQFRRRYILKHRRPPTYQMVLGDANHDTHERSYAEKLTKQRLVSPAEAAEFFTDEAWPRRVDLEGGLAEINWAKRGDGFAPPRPDEALDAGVRMVRGYTHQVVPRVEVETVGQDRFDLWVPGLPIPVIGYTDLFEKDGPVLDIKTVSQKTSTIPGKWQLQSRLYAMAHQRGVEFHTIPRTKEPNIQTALESPALLMPFEEGQARLTERLVLRAAIGMNDMFVRFGPDDPWPANFMSDACGWCGFRSTCSYWL